MATAPIIWADSFGSRDLSAYTQASGALSVGGGRGGRNAYGVPAALQWVTPSSYSLWIVSYAIRLDSGGGTNEAVVNAGGVIIQIEGVTKKLFPNISSGSLTSRGLIYGAWIHLAVRIYYHASAGTIDIWFDEANVLSLSGLNTGAAPSSVAMSASVGNQFSVCDLVIQASNTSTDLPVGDRAVSLLLPTGAGNYAQFALTGAATNWQAVSEVPPDNDTSYVSSSTAGQRDSYAMADLPANTLSVAAVVAKLRARKTDAGSRTLNPAFRIAGTDYDGTAQTLGTSYLQQYQVYNTNPATSAAWTPSDVNGAEFGEKLAS